MSDFVSMPNPLAEGLAAHLRAQGYDVHFRIENGKPLWEGQHAGKVPLSAVEDFYKTILDDEKNFWRLTADGEVVRSERCVFNECCSLNHAGRSLRPRGEQSCHEMMSCIVMHGYSGWDQKVPTRGGGVQPMVHAAFVSRHNKDMGSAARMK